MHKEKRKRKKKDAFFKKGNDKARERRELFCAAHCSLIFHFRCARASRRCFLHVPCRACSWHSEAFVFFFINNNSSSFFFFFCR